ncbi:MAG: T9SS type A sorting domain-containing protein, partial [Bacteroidales bacterium]|nr:T9SS type A sorting domain-containing protein [Bacteroidales bacterium]
FEATLNYGNGIALDNIIVFADSEYVDIKTVNNNVPKITLYPNPAKEQTFVDITNTNAKNITCTIYDLAGRKVKSQYIKGCGIHPIDINGLRIGTYLIQFLSNTFEKTELLIVK